MLSGKAASIGCARWRIEEIDSIAGCGDGSESARDAG
jgi:hypothetical protein